MYAKVAICRRVVCSAMVLFLAGSASVWADGGVTFTNIADGGGAGIDYVHVAPPRELVRQSIINAIAAQPVTTAEYFGNIQPYGPQKARGTAGVAILDYDNDGDMDLYVTNGPGSYNSLFQNQLADTGVLEWVDVGAASGAGAYDQESSGVCFGDIDNDGDHDLYVTGLGYPNVLLENQGDGTFVDITAASGAGGSGRYATGCTMADFNGDSLLDIVVANTNDTWDHRLPIFGPSATYPFFEHTYHFRNTGGNVFADVSAASGLEDVQFLKDVPGTTGAAYSWAVSSSDYDLDGDVDIFFSDNQGPAATNPDEYRGAIRLYQNDGSGNFTEATTPAQLDLREGWMGMDFGDLNCDGYLDLFATNLGYLGGTNANSRWFFGGPGGVFTDSNTGPFAIDPFGWGNAIFDYDNDGDPDIIYQGGDDLLNNHQFDNPGVVFQNTGECSGEFIWHEGAFSFDHRTRQVEGLAAGDVNGDGFEDVVTASNFDTEPFFPVPFVPFIVPPTGSPFDDQAFFELKLTFFFVPGFMIYVGPTDGDGNPIFDPPGTVAVDLNSGDNGNNWAEVTLLGNAGLFDSGSGGPDVNRDGIGGVVFFTPEDGNTAMVPIVGGASYASQSALPANFGLGAADEGTAEVLWPGGVRNCLHDVEAGERVVFPYIPCSYDGNWKNFGKYNSCVQKALNKYKQEGIITSQERNRFRDSAREAFQEGACFDD